MYLLHTEYQEALETKLSDVTDLHQIQQVGQVFGTGSLSGYRPAP